MGGRESDSGSSTPDCDVDEYRQAMRPIFADIAKEWIWDDDDWDLFLRSKIPEIISGEWNKEDLLIAASYLDFDDPDVRWRLKTGAEWEPDIPDDDTVVRRYLNFDKFISLIVNGGFWFSNIKQFPDKYETALPEPNVSRVEMFTNDREGEVTENQVTYGLRQQRKRDKHTYVSCWRMGESESAVFWDAYIGDKKGVAVQSTVGKLRRHLEDDVWDGYINKLIERGRQGAENELAKLMIGEVEYLDYENEPISNSSLSPALFFHKRNGFKDEQEFRLVKVMGRLTPEEELPEPKEGLILPGDMEAIVEKVVLPPDVSDSFAELTKSISEQHFNAPIQFSKLDRDPPQVEL